MNNFSLAHICLAALSTIMLLGFAIRLLLGVFDLLAKPTYLVFHTLTYLFKFEFHFHIAGKRKLLSDFCATLAFLGCLHPFVLLAQSIEGGPDKFIHLIANNISNTEALLTIAMFVIVCFLSIHGNKATTQEAENASVKKAYWFDKMRTIKFPPPFDWI